MSKSRTSSKNGFTKFSNKAKVSNVLLLKKVIDYKRTLPKSDSFWNNISRELENFLDKFNNKNLDNRLVNLDNEDKYEDKQELIRLLRFIRRNMNEWQRKVKYSKALRPLFRKEKRVRKLIKNILNYLEKGKTSSGNKRTNLFKIDQEYGNLQIKGKLKNAYTNVLKEELSENYDNKLMVDILNIYKGRFKNLIKMYGKLFNNNTDWRNYDFNQLLSNMDKTGQFEIFFSNLSQLNKLIKKKLKEKIDNMRNTANTSRKQCFDILTFMINYNQFIKEINDQHNGNNANINNLDETIKQFKRRTSPVPNRNGNVAENVTGNASGIRNTSAPGNASGTRNASVPGNASGTRNASAPDNTSGTRNASAPDNTSGTRGVTGNASGNSSASN